MEFFTSATIFASATDLQHRLLIGELPHWCSSIEKVLRDAKSHGEIYCVWGVFQIQREDLHYGVRFSLNNCPYALQWTVTTGHDPNPQHTYIHLTTNRSEHDPDFIDSIKQFMDDWKTGLSMHW